MRLNRSYETIRDEDLAKLAAIARSDREDLFDRRPNIAAMYRGRLLCVTLCQGAALHFLNGHNGVKDFDVWTFYKAHPEKPFPYRRNVPCDFGDPRFGSAPNRPNFTGRCVDLIGRSIPWRPGQTAVQAVRKWLQTSPAKSPRLLAQKAVVILEPEDEIGMILWPAWVMRWPNTGLERLAEGFARREVDLVITGSGNGHGTISTSASGTAGRLCPPSSPAIETPGRLPFKAAAPRY